MECPKLFCGLGFQRGIVRRGGGSLGHHCMSGIYNIEHYVMTWWFSNCEQRSFTWLLQYTLLHNKSCEREAGKTDPYGPQEMAIQAH